MRLSMLVDCPVACGRAGGWRRGRGAAGRHPWRAARCERRAHAAASRHAALRHGTPSRGSDARAFAPRPQALRGWVDGAKAADPGMRVMPCALQVGRSR